MVIDMTTIRTPIKPATKVNITPTSLLMLRRALQAQDKQARMAAERDLMAELRLQSWEFISRRAHYPGVRYIDDAKLRWQLEAVLEKALYRPEGLTDV